MALSIKDLVESCRFDLKPPYSIVVKAIADADNTSNAEAIRRILEIAFGSDMENAPPEAQAALTQYRAIVLANEQAMAGGQAGKQAGKPKGGSATSRMSISQPPPTTDRDGQSPKNIDDLFGDEP